MRKEETIFVIINFNEEKEKLFIIINENNDEQFK